MSETSVETARRLLKEITPQRWRSEHSLQRGYTVWGQVDHTGSMQIAATGHAEFDRHNAALIAESPRLLSALCDENEALAKALKEMSAKFRACAIHVGSDAEFVDAAIEAICGDLISPKQPEGDRKDA